MKYILLSAVLALNAAAMAQTTKPIELSASQIRGVSWSDPRDNYNPAQIVPAHLSLADTPESAAKVAQTYATRVQGIGVNVVRLGINPPTVNDTKWWSTYSAVIRTLTGNGLGVILCAWEQSPTVHGNGRGGHNGRFGAGTVDTYAAMWNAVHAIFKDDTGVIGYELLNEPFGYRGKKGDYVSDMRTLIKAIGDDRRGKKILVAGIGYSDDVQVIKNDFPEPDVWFAYHVYPNWFGGEAGDALFTRERYADEIAQKLKGVESRTVITEFGCWGGPAYDYSKPSVEQIDLSSKRHVAYLHGVADACEKFSLGSIYWFADARETRRHRAYDLLAEDGKLLDEDRYAQVKRAWRMK
ncbi:MAG: cellulase family glycosylhydrolase [Tepidisphaeraceae bacterium]